MVKIIAGVLVVLGAQASKCPNTVTPLCSNLDLARYAGRWYEQVNSKSFTIDDSLQCVTADYSANSDGTVKVHNVGAKNAPTGVLSLADGTAKIADLKSCALSVKFSAFQPVGAPYQIFDTDYDSYAVIVSCVPVVNALGLSDIWILSRTPKMPTDLLNSLLKKLDDAGFDYADKRYQVQETNCNYETNLLSQGATKPLVTFDGAAGTTFKFEALNDPVMGGQSTGTWSLGDGFGALDGEVVNVPSLSAPGFIKAAADGKFPDVSSALGGNLVLKVRSSTPEFAGYRVTFVAGATSGSFACAAGGSLPLSRGCFKAKFSVPAGNDFTEIRIPFADFSDKWSSATGEQTTTCVQSADVCPTAAKLAKIQRVELWGEGANGKLHIEVQSISAEDASGNVLQII